MVATAVCFFAIIAVFYTLAKRRRDVDKGSKNRKRIEGSHEGQQQNDLTANETAISGSKINYGKIKKGKVMRISNDGHRFQAMIMSLSPINEGADVHVDVESLGIPPTLTRSIGSNETRIDVNGDASAVEVDVMPEIDIGCKPSECM